ncbi:hypothetical protein FKP32DRAFT_1668934 [Trametes sanguinea]|nr:hypothetical protein FKP32DRAFT_1668934 [Trametes sanguinea]
MMHPWASRAVRGHSRRSSPFLFWDASSLMASGNPSSIYVDPDGSVVASDGTGENQGPASEPKLKDSTPSGGGSLPSSSTGISSTSDMLSSAVVSTSTQASSTISSSSILLSSTLSSSIGMSSSYSTTQSSSSLVSQSTGTTTFASSSTSAGSASITSSFQTSTGSSSATSTPITSSSTSSVESGTSASTTTSPMISPPPRINSASSSDAAARRTSAYIGIAFAAIAGAGLIVAILAWWLRSRSRSRRRAMTRMTSWPWDPDRLGSGRNPSLEGGLGIRAERDMVERGGVLRSPISHIATSDHAFPAFPPPAHTQGGYGSPYVTVQLHDAHQSVPDLAPDLGTLQITNFAPGDHSGGESSRASTAPLNSFPGEYDTPLQLQRPRFLGVDNGGLDVPWKPLRVRRAGSARAQHAGPIGQSEKLDESLPLPYPQDIAVAADGPPVAHGQRQESWAASIKMNLVNAFNAVVGGNPSQVSTANDNFTYAPHRNSQRSQKTPPRAARDTNLSASVERPGTTRSDASGWSLEERQDGAGIVHIRGASQHPDALPAEDPFADNIHLPPPAFISQRDGNSHLLSALPPGSVTRASSVYSTASFEGPIERVCDEPPRLPTIDSLTRKASGEGAQPQPQDDDVSRKRGKTQRQKQSRRARRPTLLTRKSSSQDSAMSIGSEMSRTSSAASELTDGERFAKHALRERRRRVMEMTVGRNKTRRPRATLLSRRERGKQQQRD